MFNKISLSLSSVARRISQRISWNADTLGYVLLLVMFCLTPMFFLPMIGTTLGNSKTLLVTIFGAAGLLLYSFATLARGHVTIPKNWSFLALAAVVISTILSACLSGSVIHNFFGYAGELTTAFFVILFAVIVFLASRFINSFQRVSGLYIGLIGLGAVLVIHHVLRFIIGPAFLSFGAITSNTATLIGTWNDLAIFLGALVFLIVTLLEFAGLKKMVRGIIMGLGAIILIMLLIMNLKIVWIILGIVSFLLALYIFSFAYWDPGTKMYKKETRIPVYTLIVFIISIAAILLGGYVNSFASKYQNISYSEVRPSFVTTIQVGARSMTKNFVTGTGSNSFNDAWKLVKPQNISGTQYGSANFQLGFGTFPTFMALGGVIGLIVWLLFFGTIVWTGVKTVTRPFDHPMSRFFIVSLVLLILYLIIFGFVYIISISLMIILAILLGSFFGILRAYGYGDEIDLAFIKDPRTSFFGIIILVAIMLISIFGLYTIIRKFGSLNRFQTGSMELLQSASRDEGRVKLDQAIALSNNDIFHRQLASLAISDTQEFLNSDQAGQLSKDELKTTIQRLSFAAIGQANAAIAYNKNDAQNWIAQGDVYRFLTRTQIFSDAYDKAVESYTQAQHRNPKDATMDLYFAQLEIAHNNPEKARELITASINRQPTPDAYILKYQMDLADKNTDAAFSSLRQAINLDPYNVSFYYEYGLLTYGQKRYDEAAAAFNQVLILNRSYVQAYFYLAVSLERSGNTDQANRVIEFLHNSNENTDKILDQLRNADTVPTVPVAAVTTVTKPDPVAQTPKKQ